MDERTYISSRELSHATLISRKAKRRVTMEEVKAKFGEDVEIV
jgi:hypothetical protein